MIRQPVFDFESNEKDKKERYKRRAFFAGLIFLFALLQNTPHILPGIFGAHALILIPLVVCLGMFEKAVIASLLGIFAGVLWDIHAAVADGFNALILMAFATLASILISYLMRNNIRTAMLLCICAVVIYSVLHWFIFVICTGATGGFITLITFYLPSAVYTLVFAPLIYILLRAVLRKLKEDGNR